jgi:7,8-dihydroneopterin aldolase/epimerase/oxygenase
MLHSYHEPGTAARVRSIGRVTDTVSIRDLQVTAVIGVYDWEREIEQALTFSVDMAADVAKAAKHDDISDTLDYSAVARAVKAVVTEGKFRLIETAAEAVAQRLIADFGLEWVRVEVVKPIPSEGYTAAITIERGRNRAQLVLGTGETGIRSASP